MSKNMKYNLNKAGFKILKQKKADPIGVMRVIFSKSYKEGVLN